jgi:hypothetical protein
MVEGLVGPLKDDWRLAVGYMWRVKRHMLRAMGWRSRWSRWSQRRLLERKVHGVVRRHRVV